MLKPSDLTFQSTRPSRGATKRGEHPGRKNNISIHAPLAGRDRAHVRRHLEIIRISIHAPLAGRDSKCAQKSRTYLR